MWKNSLIIGLMLVATTGYFFWTSRSKQNTPQGTPSVVVVGETPRPENAAKPRENVSEINRVSRVKNLLDIVLTEEELASPDWQEWMPLVESPEFAVFLETNPTSFTDFFDFYESQGMKSYKSEVFGMFQDMFAEHFPEKNAAALEPRMRQELSVIFTEDNMEFEKAIQDFLAEEQNIAWVMEHFEGDFLEFGKWAVTVNENPVPLPTDTPTVVENVENSEALISTGNELPDNPTFSEAFQDPQNGEQTNQEPLPVTEDPLSTLADMEHLIKSDAELEAEFLKLLEQSFPEASKLPTIVEFEKDLRERFSPQRFNTAMQTLNHYGPEEGLRKLKESDPEVAMHFERLIQRRPENR